MKIRKKTAFFSIFFVQPPHLHEERITGESLKMQYLTVSWAEFAMPTINKLSKHASHYALSFINHLVDTGKLALLNQVVLCYFISCTLQSLLIART